MLLVEDPLIRESKRTKIEVMVLTYSVIVNEFRVLQRVQVMNGRECIVLISVFRNYAPVAATVPHSSPRDYNRATVMR